MRIRSMTATFGKLEHETLTLEPGLNVITAPNEWGKSTWCAFLVAMLYGVETRAKSTKSALADKERYAPWSGSSMAGRIDLEWQGRAVTIERSTRGRIPLGEFRAYETESGLSVPELTAANCGQMLLGVERSVFLRAGFIRLGDLPVTGDDALRSRLNALVTTGDESGDAERLARGLKELKNRCRYNRTGLLPQAEEERAALEENLRELETLHSQAGKLVARLDQTDDWLAALENHRDALCYGAACEDARRVESAREALEAAARREAEAEQRCQALPARDQAQWAVNKLEKLRRDYLDLRMEAQMLLQLPEMPVPDEAFRGMNGQEAIASARADAHRYAAGFRKKPLLPLGGLLLTVAGAVASVRYLLPGVVCAAAGVCVLIVALALGSRRKRIRNALEIRYGSGNPEAWIASAESYAASLEAAEKAREQYLAQRSDLDERSRLLQEKISRCTQGIELDDCLESWKDVISAWDAWADARRERLKAENYLKTLQAMAKTAQRPALTDKLTYTEQETARLISDAQAERRQIESRLDQYRGRLAAMESKETVRARLDRVNARIGKLEDTYAALTIAQQTLAEAAKDLQRRFAPRISRRAQELMTDFTGGRYTRLTLGEDLGLRAGAGEEDTLREALWRSDGTVDQLYLALRLAVAEALTEDAPLILDDALARFDDARLAAAMRILQKEAEGKQVLIFTCQSRERNML